MGDEELQTAEPAETQGTEAELAPATNGEDVNDNAGESEVVTKVDTDPKGYTKAINKKHYELMEERRKTAGLEAELEKAKASLPTASRPSIPGLPDRYDDNYEEQMASRDDAIKSAAAFDAQETSNAERQAAIAADQAKLSQQQTVEREGKFLERARTSGITDNEITTSLQTVASYGGVGADLATFIMESETGPAVAAYLAQNPEEIISIQGMTPAHGAVYISNVVQQKAAEISRTSNAPPPADTLGGGGAPPIERGPTGATYE